MLQAGLLWTLLGRHYSGALLGSNAGGLFGISFFFFFLGGGGGGVGLRSWSLNSLRLLLEHGPIA